MNNRVVLWVTVKKVIPKYATYRLANINAMWFKVMRPAFHEQFIDKFIFIQYNEKTFYFYQSSLILISNGKCANMCKNIVPLAIQKH